MAEENDEGLLEIDRRLKEDADGALKARLAGQIDEHLQSVERKLKVGVPPKEYEELNTLKLGLAAAQTVLEATWRRHHGA